MGVGASGKTFFRVIVPLRVSFFGGGTDFESFYSKHVGSVLSCAIQKYLTIHTELEKGGALYPNVFCSHWGQGLGASSAMFVARIAWQQAMYREGSFGTNPTPLDPAEIAERAFIEESKVSTVGKQDHIACAIGGMNLMTLYKSKALCHRVLKPSILWMESVGLLWPTKTVHDAQNILVEQDRKSEINEEILLQMKALVMQGFEAMGYRHPIKFGTLLLQTWALKQKLAAGISDDNINQQFEVGLSTEGCCGGKLLGAGGGGWFFFIFRDEEARNRALLILPESEPLRISRTGVQLDAI
jgi:D-glycero-alpha-D-manno-heptose-7-phosphate kinase